MTPCGILIKRGSAFGVFVAILEEPSTTLTQSGVLLDCVFLGKVVKPIVFLLKVCRGVPVSPRLTNQSETIARGMGGESSSKRFGFGGIQFLEGG